MSSLERVINGGSDVCLADVASRLGLARGPTHRQRKNGPAGDIVRTAARYVANSATVCQFHIEAFVANPVHAGPLSEERN